MEQDILRSARGRRLDGDVEGDEESGVQGGEEQLLNVKQAVSTLGSRQIFSVTTMNGSHHYLGL